MKLRARRLGTQRNKVRPAESAIGFLHSGFSGLYLHFALLDWYSAAVTIG